jgi:hypothetical protein
MADYTHTVTEPATIDTIRVEFTNNGYHNGRDRNVQIDYIDIDGTRHQTEAPTTRSLGTYTPTTGCTQGFHKTEHLHCNGWFQYDAATGTNLAPHAHPTCATTPGPPEPANPTNQAAQLCRPDNDGPPATDTITIRARGHTGTEAIALTINGTTVATFTNLPDTFTNHTHTTNGAMTIDTITVDFTNNGYHNGQDRNVQIDYLQIGNTRYQTEDPTNHSTGTWNTSTHCTPGYKKSETLHCNGSLLYNQATGVILH